MKRKIFQFLQASNKFYKKEEPRVASQRKVCSYFPSNLRGLTSVSIPAGRRLISRGKKRDNVATFLHKLMQLLYQKLDLLLHAREKKVSHTKESFFN
jgi:hypothetical protein